MLRGGGPVFARKGEPFLLRRGFAAPKLRRSPHEWEFALEECGLSSGSILACAVDLRGLPTGKRDFVNEVFASGGATRFPRYEDMGRDKAADGRGGVAEEGCGFFHGDTLGGFKLYRSFHRVHFSIEEMGMQKVFSKKCAAGY